MTELFSFGKKRLKSVSPRDILVFLLGALIMFVGIKLVTLIRTPVPLEPESPDITIRWLPATVKQWRAPILEMSKKYNLDPNLIAIIITLESGGYAKSESSAGARGLMQITPLTAQDIAAKFLKEPRKNYDLLNPRTNIEFGTAYLSYLRDEFGAPSQGPSWVSTVELLAAGYNGGPGAANRLEQGKGLTDVETVVYSRDAFNMWRERHAAKSPTYERWLERGGFNLVDMAKAAQ